ncbi:MAG: class I SAM-dependent rRNA methyltransferase [Kofleriaceae bacterium]|nr:class I SAM-dependent rRNA methyltransferase [Kofleriaceae bacterium]MBP9204939.1 class I SAM-dependent rRNA methyltransferase [Kofleriaceae bacterium]
MGAAKRGLAPGAAVSGAPASVGQYLGRPTWALGKPLRASIRSGHPWVYDRGLAAAPAVAAGDLVVVVDGDGPIAVGFAEPASPIAVRVLDLDPSAVVGDAWTEERATRAARLRVTDPALASTDGLRWIHGENDRCPGLVVDGYAGAAVVVFDGPAAEAFWAPRLGAVLSGLRAGGANLTTGWIRGQRGHKEGRALGAAPPDEVVIREGPVHFAVDVRAGQKTGFFLDQRANRAFVGARAAGARVLNLFSYTGGFSLHAAAGGARAVTSVDLAAPAIAAVRRNLELSGLPAGPHELVAADAFLFLAEARRAGRVFDVVVVDPPSFAPSAKARGNALASYRGLARAAAAVVAPGGALAFASCSSHITEDDLRDCLAGVERDLRIVHAAGPATDHPTLPAFPEGRYLKFLWAVACD